MTTHDLHRPHPVFNPFALVAGLLFWSVLGAAVFALWTAVGQ